MELNESLNSAETPKVIDLSTFEDTKDLVKGLSLVVQFKGFNRKKRLSQRSTQIKNNQAGSSSLREISPGAIMIFPTIPADKTLTETAAASRYLVKDSRGLAFEPKNKLLYFVSVDEVLCLDLVSRKVRSIASSKSAPLAFIHSLTLSPDGKRLLVTSSGLDRIVELDIETGKAIREWSAWEHGYNRSINSKRLIYTSQPHPPPHEEYIVINDVKKFAGGLGLPPGERTAFPNSAIYVNQDKILATLFHHGLIEIDLKSGKVLPVNLTLHNPHSILPFKDGYIVTNTAKGQAIILDKDLNTNEVLDFTKLPGLDPDADGREWLQHVRPISESRLAAVDSNRTSIFLIELEGKKIQRIPIDQNWVLQEIHPLPEIKTIPTSAYMSDVKSKVQTPLA